MATHYLEIALRSSLAVKGLIIANGTGKVDLDYLDEIGLIVHNPISGLAINANGDIVLFGAESISSLCQYEIKKGDKVAQATLIKHEVV